MLGLWVMVFQWLNVVAGSKGSKCWIDLFSPWLGLTGRTIDAVPAKLSYVQIRSGVFISSIGDDFKVSFWVAIDFKKDFFNCRFDKSPTPVVLSESMRWMPKLRFRPVLISSGCCIKPTWWRYLLLSEGNEFAPVVKFKNFRWGILQSNLPVCLQVGLHACSQSLVDDHWYCISLGYICKLAGMFLWKDR